MDSKEIKKKINEKGYVRAIIVFEVIGNPKDYVKRALEGHISKLKADDSIDILSEAIENPEKQDNLWSSFAEVEVLVKGLEKLTWICFQFMPASIEIMAPETLVFKGRDITNWLNDLLSKNHEVGLLSQQVGQENKLMLKNINALIRNSILIGVDAKINKPSDIAKKIGIHEKDLKPVFEAMIKEGKLTKRGSEYHRK